MSSDPNRVVFKTKTINPKKRKVNGDEKLDAADSVLTEVITPGRVLADGTIIEECFDGANAYYYICPGIQEDWPQLQVIRGIDYRLPALNVRLLPMVDELLIKGKVMLPIAPLEYGEPIDLYDAWIKWAQKYYDGPEDHFKLMASYYLLSAVYDKCPALPEFNFRGPPQSGKTRGFEELRHTCYRGMRASGSLTHSAMFRATELWKGTLCINESDMRQSDATVDIIKYLNERYEKGGCVWRSNPDTFAPQCFDSFGPTVLTSRQPFDDDALESRQIDLETRGRKKKKIPLNLPPAFFTEAQELRDKLLMFRFRNYQAFENDYTLEFDGISSRLNQILQPLASLSRNISDELFEEIKGMAKSLQQQQVRAASLSTDGMIVNAFFTLEGQTYKEKDEQGNIIREVPIRMTATNLSKCITRLGGEVSAKTIGSRVGALGFKKRKTLDGNHREITLPDSSDRRDELKKAYVSEELADSSDELDSSRKRGGGLEGYAPKVSQGEKVSKIAEIVRAQEITPDEFAKTYPELASMLLPLMKYGRLGKKPNGTLYCHQGMPSPCVDANAEASEEG
jgi:hypothetical protein